MENTLPTFLGIGAPRAGTTLFVTQLNVFGLLFATVMPKVFPLLILIRAKISLPSLKKTKHLRTHVLYLVENTNAHLKII